AVGNTGSDGADKIDGGKGTDTYDARDAINIVKINLDAIEHSAIAANTATGSDVAGAFTDSITGFENAKGGGGADWLMGTAATNTLEGGAGNDTLAGLSGRDILVGGADADSFLFLSIKDSGATAVTRDLIKDFETGDIIDLTGIDANVTNAPNTNDGFAFIGTNVNF